MNRFGYIFLFLLLLFAGCDKDNFVYTEQGIVFSQDTLCFDTVFTEKGSTTRIFKLYNSNRKDITIQRFMLQDGRYFNINIDGESNMDNLKNYLLAGGDSLFVFIEAFIDPQDRSVPVLVEDKLLVEADNNTYSMQIEAYGQYVEILDRLHILSDTTLQGLKPYYVLGYVETDSLTTLTINKGAVFYMGDSAQFIVRGALNAVGTLDEPIVFRGSRTYNIYERVPYDYVSGLWSGIFLLPERNTTNKCEYVDIHSATVGLYCYSQNGIELPQIQITNSRIHNNAIYGLVIQNFDAKVVNSEITNCARNCVYLAGGRHTFIHNTIASYFNSSNVSLHSIGKENVSAMFVNNLSKYNAKTVVNMSNNIVAGSSRHNFTLATPLPEYYIGTFHNNCLKTDTIENTQFTANVFVKNNDELFANTFFDRRTGEYYNFSLDSLSVARDTADIEIAKLYPFDRLGHDRLADGKPDIGCYEYKDEEE